MFDCASEVNARGPRGFPIAAKTFAFVSGCGVSALGSEAHRIVLARLAAELVPERLPLLERLDLREGSTVSGPTVENRPTPDSPAWFPPRVAVRAVQREVEAISLCK